MFAALEGQWRWGLVGCAHEPQFVARENFNQRSENRRTIEGEFFRIPRGIVIDELKSERACTRSR
jgi:hypothetical protein